MIYRLLFLGLLLFSDSLYNTHPALAEGGGYARISGGDTPPAPKKTKNFGEGLVPGGLIRPIEGMRSLTVTSTGGRTLPDENAPQPANEQGHMAAPATLHDIVQIEKVDFEELRLMNMVVVKRVIDPLRVETQDGKIYQLANIDYPDSDPHDPGPLMLSAHATLKQLLEGKRARLYQTKTPDQGRLTRMGDELAHLEVVDGDIWIQGLLLANGFARVFPSERNVQMAGAMLVLEDEARTHKRGLWNDARFARLDAKEAAQGMDKLSTVEGIVRGVATVNNRTYLNFDRDWQSDFTIGLQPAIRRLLEKDGVDPLSLNGKSVRVRGWVEEYNGPFIELTHPAWLEILPDKK